MIIYSPLDWYWLDDNGRVYSSARQMVIDDNDATFIERKAEGKYTPWPRDESGAQADAALQGVLSRYNLNVDFRVAKIASLTNSCDATIVGGYVSSALGELHTYPSGVTDQINMMGSVTASLLPSLGSGWTTPFWCEDASGVWAFRDHTAAQIQQAGSDGKAHVVECQTTLATLSAQVVAAADVAAVGAVGWPAN